MSQRSNQPAPASAPAGAELFAHDLRHAARSLARSPGFVVTAVLSLALGIGASAAAFSVLDAVRFRALPFPDADRLMVLSEVPAGNGAPPSTCRTLCDVSYETFSQVLQRYPFRSLDAVIGFTGGLKAYDTGEETVPVQGGVVSPNVFSLLRVRAEVGRVLTAEDDRLGVSPAVLLSHNIWTNRFAQDPDILGRVIKFSDTRYTVVGVMPAGFEFERGSEIWLPAVPTLDPSTRPSIRSLSVVGRLKPGATLAQLRAELSTITPTVQLSARGQQGKTRIEAAPLRTRYVTSTQSHDTIFAAVVGCVLLIAVANLATLLLVRTLQQERELAVRAALGGGMGRLMRYLFAQHLLIVAGGAVLGLVFAQWSLGVLRSLAVLGSIRPPGMEYRIDGHVVVFAVLLSILIVAVLGLVPARLVRRLDVQRVLRESAPSGGGSLRAAARGGMAQQLFVVAQIACAAVLLTGAGLMAKTVLRLASVDLGFDNAQLVQGTPSFPHPWRVKETYLPVSERILAELKTIPGAASATMRAYTRLGTRSGSAEVRLQGTDTPLPTSIAPQGVIAVSPEYFETMGVKMVRGRTFSALDRETTIPVAIVNEWAARRWWPGADPIGRMFRIDTAPGEGVMMTVVGVARDNKGAQPNVLLAEDGPELYRPYEQAPSAFPTYLVRADSRIAPASLLKPSRTVLVAAVPDRPLFLSLSSEQVSRQLEGVRTNALQILGFALAGLLLALVGIHGVLAYTVRRRTREIGIRGALGATGGQLRLMILTDAALISVIGLAIGLPIAAASTRLIRDLLHGTSATDPATYAVVGVVILVVSLVASWLPAHRAARVDPVTALRAG